MKPQPAQPEASPRGGAGATSATGYSVAVGHLRGVLTLLVVTFHAALAYYPGPFPFSLDVLRMSYPVRDGATFRGAQIIASFNDMFFMSLFFLLSGLFVWGGLTRKGPWRFLQDRAIRLGIPFLVAAGLGGAIAYYPTYLQATPAASASLGDYARTWLTWSDWRSGAAWFVAVLLLFDVVAAGLAVAAPRWGARLAALAAGSARAPLRFFALGLALSAVAYIPLAMAVTPWAWWHSGPFWLQESRALHYLAYFFIGAALGAYGLDRGLLARDGALARHWAWWTVAMVGVFLAAGNIVLVSLRKDNLGRPLWSLVGDAAWVIDCATTSFAFLALFVRFARPGRILDSLARNAYGIYLVHYPIVSWLQYALLGAHISPIAKFAVVAVVALASSWLLAAALRRIPILGRII